MPAGKHSALDSINRRGWLLWVVTFAVILSLTATVPILYLPLLEMVGVEEHAQLWVKNGYYAGVGLAGLVLIFCLYTALKHRELNAMREALHREERELEDVRTRLSEISALFQVSTTLNLQLRLDAILEIIVRRVVSTLRAQQASVMIYNPESGVLETRASYGLESEFARHARARMGEGIAGWVAECKEAVLLGQGPNEAFNRHYKNNRNITSALSLPLKVGDRCVGVLNVNRINHPDPFLEHHRDMLRLFAEHVGAVIDRAEVMERMATRTADLMSSNLKLSEMNRMKDVLLSTASHELKTPLTSVIAYAELLDDSQGQLSADQRGEFLRRLRQEANHLLGLIDDILDLSRLETGKLTLHCEALAVNQIAHAAVESARNTAQKYGIELIEEFDAELGTVSLDEVKIRQVILNLLVNAIKFSPENGAVRIGTRRDTNFVVIEVTDEGPGIRPEESAHIFELFGQGVRQMEKRPSGLGIGLHLVKRITELHGGHVGVNSSPGHGSNFWVRVPIADAQAPAEREAA
ncbi:MAG TPA: GAF domain-containing sensor histidine kinase [Candidatus Limnocylindria bacterium]|nr:GAF domain-containing sensor histidine kinase [Candidatus Limnocylindria bacterium]